MVTIGFWMFMFLMVLLTPISMLWMGKQFRTNYAFRFGNPSGYRTSMSIKNEETWEFAHLYSGKLYLWCGRISLPLSVIPMFFVLRTDLESISRIGILGGIICGLQIIGLVYPIVFTELALRRNFDKDGNRME